VVPVHLAGHDQAGRRLVAPAELLPPGGRRASLLAHAYRSQLIGLSTRTFTGWLEVSPGGAVYAPHTSRGFVAPPRKNLLLVLNGLLASLAYALSRVVPIHAHRYGTQKAVITRRVASLGNQSLRGMGRYPDKSRMVNATRPSRCGRREIGKVDDDVQTAVTCRSDGQIA